MSLAPGTRLGPYAVLTQIGAGGMGEVYRATDTNLKRQVAIKVLPDSVATDRERLARFQREAELLAALNHPNIAQIHGLERSDGHVGLVMELVEGPTLADRIARGPIPMDEALPIAKQMADALEAAHEQGIIHRDLKPANIKVRDDGTVKVLDFGLAKVLGPGSEGSGLQSDLANSPTMTSPAMTQTGMILGTAAYMSPEQARGRPVDKRADVWAFGCVLFEMLTGRRAFGGKDLTDVLAAVVRADPDWSALPSGTPRAMVTLLRRSLRKDPQQRLPNLSAARLDIDDAISGVGAESSGQTEVRPRGLSSGVVAATAGLMAASAALAWMLKASPAPATREPVRVQVTLPAADELNRGARNLAVSPDGHTLAYVAVRDGVSGLYVRPLAAFDATLLAGTEGAYNPFFSPDGRWLGFFAQDKMKRIAVNGGAAATIVQGLGLAPGATWSADNTIVYSPSVVGRSGLWRVSAEGGTPAMLTTPDTARGEYSHRYPHILPGGRAVLFTSLSGFGWDETNVEAVLLETGERRVLVRGGQTAQYVPDGHLLYVRAGTLLDVSFDPERLEVASGDPVTIAGDVMQHSGPNGSLYAASATGTIAYAPAPGGTRLFEQQLIWIDRQGRQSPTRAPPRNYSAVALSPDGEGMVVTIRAGTDDLWRYDPGRDVLVKLTSGPRSSREAVWSPDGRNIAYRSNATGRWQIHSIPADGSATQGTPLLVSGGDNWPTSFSPDGRTLAFVQSGEATLFDVWTLPLDGDRAPQSFIETTAVESEPQFSPNGRWLAYTSDASGGTQVYVAPFPGPGRRIQISTDGGDAPQWNPKGGELFYRSGNRTMVVSVTTAGTFAAGRPRVLYEGPSGQVAPDGQRFLAIAAVHGEQVNQINVMIDVLK